jgi:hypothetical protein
VLITSIGLTHFSATSTLQISAARQMTASD